MNFLHLFVVVIDVYFCCCCFCYFIDTDSIEIFEIYFNAAVQLVELRNTEEIKKLGY